MPDKTRLELDIEHCERFRTPPGVKILIVFLVIAVFALGVYTFKLRQELAKKQQEIILLKKNPAAEIPPP
ncbi:MAG: hypothetical protein GXP46_11900 [Deferribacteres bacterium]|nr:hypothetical protein [Deferribacteres bacterium]